MKYVLVVLFSVLPWWVIPAGADVMHGIFTGMQIRCDVCSPVIGTVDVDTSKGVYFIDTPPAKIVSAQPGARTDWPDNVIRTA